MGSFSESERNTMLDVTLGSGTPATVYAAAYVSSTEVSGNGYARVAITNNSTNFPDAASGAKSNGTEILFPQASGGNWGSIDEIRLHRHITNEDIICSDTFTAIAINDTDQLRIQAGDLDLTLT